MRPLGAGQAVDQPFGAVGLEVASDLVELLARIAHHLAGAADIGESAASSSSESLRRATLSLAVIFAFRLGSIGRVATPSNPLESGSASGTGRSDSQRSAPGSSVASCQVTTISGQPEAVGPASRLLAALC